MPTHLMPVRALALVGCLALCAPEVALAVGALVPPPDSGLIPAVEATPSKVVTSTPSGPAVEVSKAGHTQTTTVRPRTTPTAPMTGPTPSTPTAVPAVPALRTQVDPTSRRAEPIPPAPPVVDEPGPERIVWDRTPIRLVLPVGRERMIHFPAPVRVGVPPRIDAVLRTQSIDGTVYLQAAQPFAGTRVMVRETATGYTYLFDIAAVPSGGSTRPVEIHAPHRPALDAAEDESAQEAAAGDSAPAYGYVALTRFAAQQMYGPRRLARDLPGLLRAPLTNDPVALVRGAKIRAVPLAGWQAAGLYVTAVKLTNISHRPVILDPRDLRGQWLAATFQHARLLRAGDEADTTCVYLISARPFDAAVL